MILVNSIPKSGTHALARTVELLGCPCEWGHRQWGEEVPERHLLIVRHPKNVVISWLRFEKHPIDLERALSGFFGRPFVDFVRGFLP